MKQEVNLLLDAVDGSVNIALDRHKTIIDEVEQELLKDPNIDKKHVRRILENEMKKIIFNNIGKQNDKEYRLDNR